MLLGLVLTQVVYALPPAASFDWAPSSPAVNENVTFTSTSTDPEDDIVLYEWDYDFTGRFVADATGESATTSFSSAGAHIVALRVTDSPLTDPVTDPPGESDLDVRTVTVAGPPNQPPTDAAITAPTTATVRQSVNFTGSAEDQDNDPLNYSWNFGDGGTASGETVSHSYATAGTKTVTLTVTDGRGGSDTDTHQITVTNNAPTASIGFETGAPAAPQRVSFFSNATDPDGDPLAYNWSFGDGTGSNAANPVHMYSSPGTYSVALTVTDPSGATGTARRSVAVTVNAAPRAAFSFSSTTPLVGDRIIASSTSTDPDTPLASHEWDLDNDGAFDDAVGGVISRTFRRAGVYTLRLRVTDSLGATAVATSQIRVRRRPLAVLSNVVVRLEGNVFGSSTRVTGLVVSAPRRAKVTVRCVGQRVGSGCPRKAVKVSKSRRGLRFKTFQRSFRPKMKIIVTTTRSGYIGKHTTFIIRRGVGPLRRSQCITPGAKRPKKCPPA